MCEGRTSLTSSLSFRLHLVGFVSFLFFFSRGLVLLLKDCGFHHLNFVEPTRARRRQLPHESSQGRFTASQGGGHGRTAPGARAVVEHRPPCLQPSPPRRLRAPQDARDSRCARPSLVSPRRALATSARAPRARASPCDAKIAPNLARILTQPRAPSLPTLCASSPASGRTTKSRASST